MRHMIAVCLLCIIMDIGASNKNNNHGGSSIFRAMQRSSASCPNMSKITDAHHVRTPSPTIPNSGNMERELEEVWQQPASPVSKPKMPHRQKESARDCFCPCAIQ